MKQRSIILGAATAAAVAAIPASVTAGESRSGASLPEKSQSSASPKGAYSAYIAPAGDSKPGQGNGYGHEKGKGKGHEIGNGHGHDSDSPG